MPAGMSETSPPVGHVFSCKASSSDNGLPLAPRFISPPNIKQPGDSGGAPLPHRSIQKPQTDNFLVTKVFQAGQRGPRLDDPDTPQGTPAPAAVPAATEQSGRPGTLETCGFLWHSRCNPLQVAAQVVGNRVRWQDTWRAGWQRSQGCGSAYRT